MTFVVFFFLILNTTSLPKKKKKISQMSSISLSANNEAELVNAPFFFRFVTHFSNCSEKHIR